MIPDLNQPRLPDPSAEDNPADHILEAYCPVCNFAVDAVCPNCRGNVELAGADLKSMVRFHAASEYRRLLLTIGKYKHCTLTLWAYMLATGSALAMGESMTGIAKKCGVTKAAVSKRCRQICEDLGLPRSQYMRDEEAAEKFRQRNTRPRKMT
jgi:hypothetical protein